MSNDKQEIHFGCGCRFYGTKEKLPGWEVLDEKMTKTPKKPIRKGILSKLEELTQSGGEITASEFQELMSDMTEADHEKLHEVMDVLLRSGVATFKPDITKIPDKGLIIDGKIVIRERLPRIPKSPFSPIIIQGRHLP